jgi:hypothetical protein
LRGDWWWNHNFWTKYEFSKGVVIKSHERH